MPSIPLPMKAGPPLLDAIRIARGWFDHATLSQVPIDRAGQKPSAPVGALSVFLYANWYAAARDKPQNRSRVPLVESLRAAHHGSWSWEQGWVAERVSSAGRVVAARDRERRVLSPSDFISVCLPGLPPPVGSALCVVRRWDSTTLLQGYWVTHSRLWFSERGTFARLYWNVQTAGAPALVRQLTSALDQVPFCLKVPSEPAGFARADAAVLYVPVQVFPDLRRSIRAVHDAVREWLSPDIPPLTKPMAAGLGVAETRWNAAESFGQHRCRLIAEALIATFQGERPPDADLLSAISEQFLREGLDPSRPWLEASGADHYVL